MNIVMLGPFAFKPKGTVSARAFPIARALVRRGHQVTILMPPYDHLEDSGRTWAQDGVRLENMPLRRNDAWHQITVPVRMARRTAQLRPDVVHVFKPIGYSGLAAAYLRWFTRTPLVLDTDDWEGRGGWSDVNPYPMLWRWLFGWQERWVARHADAVTVVSRTLQTQVWGFGVDPARVVYLPNGPEWSLCDQVPISAAQTDAARAHLGVGSAPMALYLGQIPHGSDLDLAIDALARVREEMPEARLVIAGAGDGVPRLQQYAQAEGQAQGVAFPGWIERDQARLYLAAADLIVIPYRDTLVNRAKCAGKLVAAMAAGKAIVTSRVGQNLEYIEDGISGILTRPGDAPDLARALLALLRDRSRAMEMGQNAKAKIWAEFDWDVRIGEVERAYRVARARSGLGEGRLSGG
jgi:glycosyltransferase involved in cell wall biosynthesis